MVTINTDGDYTYDPNGKFESSGSGDEGVGTFTYTITDGEAGTDLATVLILMRGVSDAPDAEDDSKTTTPIDAASDNVVDPNEK